VIGAVRRWLTRPSRYPRRLRAGTAVLLGALAVVGLAAPGSPGASPTSTATRVAAAPTKLPFAPGAGNPTAQFPHSAVLDAEGMALYQQSCSSCHGIALQGQKGVAPSLQNVGAGPVDFYLSTGRMPLQNPSDEPDRTTPAFNRSQIDALIDYISSFGGPPAPTDDPSRGNLALGLREFTANCAGCHQIVGRGGLTIGAYVPNLSAATPQQIAEAVRMGPYLMPHFDSTQVDQHDLDSIARYVLWTRHPANAGGWGIYNLGPIPEGMVAWFIALAALVIVARLIGERTV
jgi:ubiquinol-cytochrome c reductase cytochrome c subunit